MRLRVCPPMLGESAADQNLAVACNVIDRDIAVRVRVERISQSRCRIESGQVIARLSADAC